MPYYCKGEEGMEGKLIDLLNEKYSVEINNIEPITNQMYKCDSQNGRYFARITNYRTYEEQFEEVSWINFLNSKGLGGASAIASKDGKTVETIMFPEKKLTVLFKAASGIHLPRSKWNGTILKELGKQIGRMHRYTKDYVQNHSMKYIKDWHENEEFDFLKYIPKEETIIRKKADQVLSTIKEIPRDHLNYGLIHGDIWLENTLVDDNLSISFVDFQDCEKHFYLYDLAVPFYSACEFSFIGQGNIKDYIQAISGALLEGYLEENIIPTDMLQMMPLFLELKELFEYSLMHMYWNKDNLTEEQVRIMNLYRIRLEYNHQMFNHLKL